MVCSSIVRTVAGCLLMALAGRSARAAETVPGPCFRFETDTFAFANQTVFIYPHGYAEKRTLKPGEKPPEFTLRCFAMDRSVEQFHKFARFDASLPPPDDAALAKLVCAVTGRAPWRGALPPEKRVVVPGYANLHALSLSRPLVVQRNIGGGWWATYLRPGNFRMFHFWWNGPSEQAATQCIVENTLAHNDLFVAYLTSYPSLSINHSVLIYGRRPATREDRRKGVIRYLVYDPNHPEASREMVYDVAARMFSYQKDWDFVGGKVTVLQIYGYPVQ